MNRALAGLLAGAAAAVPASVLLAIPDVAPLQAAAFLGLVLAGAGICLASRPSPVVLGRDVTGDLPSRTPSGRRAEQLLAEQVTRTLPPFFDAFLLDLFSIGPSSIASERLDAIDGALAAGRHPWSEHARPRVVRSDGHGHPVTRILAEYESFARRVPDCEHRMAWVAQVDRRLWYAMVSLGRAKPFFEGAGAVAHYRAETAAGVPLHEPVVPSVPEDFAYDEEMGPDDRFATVGTDERVEPYLPVGGIARVRTRLSDLVRGRGHVADLLALAAGSLAFPFLSPFLLAAGVRHPGVRNALGLHGRSKSDMRPGAVVVLGDRTFRAETEMAMLESDLMRGGGCLVVSDDVDPRAFRSMARRLRREDDVVVVGPAGRDGRRDAIHVLDGLDGEEAADAVVAAYGFADARTRRSVRGLLSHLLRPRGGRPAEIGDLPERGTLDAIMREAEDAEDTEAAASAARYLATLRDWVPERGRRQSQSTLDEHWNAWMQIAKIFSDATPCWAASRAPTTSLEDMISNGRLVLVAGFDPGNGNVGRAAGLVRTLLPHLAASRIRSLRREQPGVPRFFIVLDAEGGSSLPDAGAFSDMVSFEHGLTVGSPDSDSVADWNRLGRVWVARVVVGRGAGVSSDGRLVDQRVTPRDIRSLEPGETILVDRGRTIRMRRPSVSDRRAGGGDEPSVVGSPVLVPVVHP